MKRAACCRPSIFLIWSMSTVNVEAIDLFSVDVDHPALFYLVDGRRPSTSILQPFSSRPRGGRVRRSPNLHDKIYKISIVVFQKSTTLAYFISPSFISFKNRPNRGHKICSKKFNKKDWKCYMPNICPDIFHIGNGPNKCSYFQKFIYANPWIPVFTGIGWRCSNVKKSA